MSGPMHNEMEAALTALREQREKAEQAIGQVDEVSESVRSKDRMVKATVDAQGRLTGLELEGQRWRDLAPKELSAKIVETIQSAQQASAAKTAELMTDLLPPGLDSVVNGSATDFGSMLATLGNIGKDKQRD